MIKDIFGKEIKLGDLVYAHNSNHTTFLINPRWICLVVGENLCFATASDYNNPEKEYQYLFEMDTCLLIGHLDEKLRSEEDELREKLIGLYKEYKPNKKYINTKLFKVSDSEVV